MLMKRVWALLLVLACVLCAQGFAEPVQPQPTLPPYRHILNISFSANPAELVLPGEVTLTFTITNTSEYDAENVYIASADGLHSEPIGQIRAGDSQVFNREHTVTDAELEAGRISYTVTHDGIAGDETAVEYTIECPMERAYASPSVEFTRQFSSDFAVPGDIVTVIYSVHNAGNVPLASVRVRDTLGDFTGRVETLDVGETRLFTGKITVSRQSVSSPSLSYTVPGMGEDTYTETLSERAIPLADEQLTLSLSAQNVEARMGDTAEISITLRNLGNVDYYDICVLDVESGNIVADGLQSINGSAPIVVDARYPVRADSVHRFRVTARSESGREVDILSEPVEITLLQDQTVSGLTVAAVAEYTEISRAGEVPVKISIENAGDAVYQDVRLAEESLGELRTFALIAPNGVTEREILCHVEENAELVFSVEYADADGEARTASSAPVAIRIARGGVRPASATDAEPFGGQSVKPRGSSMYLIMLIAAGVLLIVLVVALLFSSRRARKARRQRRAQLKQRQKEELGKTNRFTPVKRPDRNRGKGE